MHMDRPARPGADKLPLRIWRNIEDTGTCWLWTAGRTNRGYGKGYLNGKHVYVHRIVYEALVAPISDGEQIDHRCHTRACCNPAHLLPVDNTGNAQNRRGAQTNSRSGVRGVHRFAGKWRVQVRAGGRTHSGGMFDDLAEAEAVAREMRKRLMPHSQ